MPVFKVGEGGSATPEGITLENKGETLLKPSSTGSRDQGPSGEIEPNRDTTRQIETTDETSPRQVAVGLSRNDREWDPPPSPALSSQPRTRHAPWQFQFCLSQREADPISLLQLPAGHRHPSQGFVRSGIPLRGWTRLGGGRSGKHPAARGSAADENGQWRQDGGLGRLARRADMTGRGSQPPLAGSQRRNGDACAPHLRCVGVGWIYCTRRLLTHRRAGGEIAVSCFLEGSCVQNAAMAAGAITRSRG